MEHHKPTRNTILKKNYFSKTLKPFLKREFGTKKKSPKELLSLTEKKPTLITSPLTLPTLTRTPTFKRDLTKK